jgi:hypothetical protein
MEARRPGLGSMGSAVEDRWRQLEGRCDVASRRCSGERWLVGYVARQGNGHPAACGAEGATLREARHQNLGSSKGMEGAACLALELGLGHRRLERKRRHGGGRPWTLLKLSQ